MRSRSRSRSRTAPATEVIRSLGGRLACAWAVFVGGALTGCDVARVVLAEPEPLVVAEIFVEASPEGDRAFALLHRALGTTALPVEGAEVTLEVAGEALTLPVADGLDRCLLPDTLTTVDGACYASALPEGFVRPGEELSARVTLVDGGVLEGRSLVPSAFELLTPEPGIGVCHLPEESEIELRWTASAGAWAYLAETLIGGLQPIIDERELDAELEEDPLRLTGLSISSADTTLAFPTEFGVFDRFDLDREIAVLLQEGLPGGATAQLTVTATDRNYVNWVRGGNFNPSGTVRVPSIFGEPGTGVLGTYVARRFAVDTDPAIDIPRCQN